MNEFSRVKENRKEHKLLIKQKINKAATLSWNLQEYSYQKNLHPQVTTCYGFKKAVAQPFQTHLKLVAWQTQKGW